MNNKNSKRALLTSVVSLAVCGSMLVGTTFAWFTDSVSSGNNVITAGNLDIEVEYTKDGTNWDYLDGKSVFDENTLWEPGHTEVVALKVSNVGSLALKYSVSLDDISEIAGTNVYDEEFNLSDLLEVSTLTQQAVDANGNENQIGNIMLGLAFKGENSVGYEYTNSFADSKVLKNDTELAPGAAHYMIVKVDMPETIGNEANYKTSDDAQDPDKYRPSIEFGLNVVATQATVEKDSFGKDYDEGATYPKKVDTWDGTADTSWYDDTATTFTLSTAEQLAGLAELVDAGNAFEGKTIKLAVDMDLYCIGEDGERVTFDPIGDKSAFKGTFDGRGHEISNMYQNGWALGYDWYNYGSVGLFGELESATVKNVTISGAESLVEGGDVGGITGSATGTCVFENIKIEDSVFATYNNGNGGIIGWSGAGNYTFKNVTIAEDVVLAGLWGSFDSSIGGVVGQGEPGATYNFENVDIACRLDVYNDCTASYDYYNYRMCGMIIGRLAKTTTIDGKNYPDMSQYYITCNNVTVTYGDWANYHYCEPTPGYNNGRGMRVEPGYSYDGLPADYDHSQCTTNHNTLIPFNQIFGGDQLGVKGLRTYDGVNVIYNK